MDLKKWSLWGAIAFEFLVIILVSVAYMKLSDQSNLSNNYNESIQAIIYHEDKDTNYENIKTANFSFLNTDDGSEIPFKNCITNLNDVKLILNNYLSDSPYAVLSIGINGSKIYIVQDTNRKLDNPLKVNILALDTKSNASDWSKTIEGIYYNYDVSASSIVEYYGDGLGQHLIYVYNTSEEIIED